MPIITLSEDDIWNDARRAEAKDRIDSLKQYGTHLTKWDREFLDSIEQYLNEHGLLTNAQQSRLAGLYDQKL